MKIRSDVTGYITGVRFYKGSGNTGTHVGHLWDRAGNLLATATFSGETATGWQQVSFATPVAISANTTYVASYYAPGGPLRLRLGYFATSGVTSGPLHALANGVDGGDGVYVYGTGDKFPNASFNSTNYWVDVVFTTTAPSGTAPATMLAAPATTLVAPTTTNPSGAASTSSQKPSKTVQTVQVSSSSGSVLAGKQPFMSPVLDAGRAAIWGTVYWKADLPPGAKLVVEIRSGNTPTPNKSWSAWSAVGNGGAVPSPLARYLQYRVSLKSGSPPLMPIPFDIEITSVANAPVHQPSPTDRVSSSSASVLAGKPFLSPVLDAGRSATWNGASWTADLPPGATLVVEVSSGDTLTPNRSWSTWSAVGNGGTITSNRGNLPSGRYLRYRVRLLTVDSLLMPVPVKVSLTSGAAASSIQQPAPPQDNLAP